MMKRSDGRTINDLTDAEHIELRAGFDAWIDKHRAEINKLKSFIETMADDTEPSILQSSLTQSVTWLARSAGYISTLKRFLSISQGNYAEWVLHAPPSIAKLIIKKYTADIEKAYTFCERANACITHSIEALRSLLSYQKTLMNNEGK